MSTDAPVTPKPSTVATATTWTSRISSILIATVIAGQQFGIVTPKNAESIKSITDKLTPIADKIETIANDKKVPDMSVVIDLADQVKKLADQIAADKKKQDEQVKPKPQPTPVDPVPQPTPTPSPDQQRIADMESQIRRLLDELAKKHEPPPPVPVPTPIASLKVLDSTGKEITQPIESGRQFKVASTTAGKWSVTSESPTTDYDVTEYPDHLVCVLRNGAKLSISHATESPLTLAAIMVRCQDAPRPTPTPVEPVEPDKKQTTQHKVGGIYICVNPGQTSVDESIVIKDLPYWDNLRATGITVSMHTPSAVDEIGKWALEQMKAKGIPPPAMVMVDRDRFLLDVVPVPKSTAAVDSIISKGK